MTSTLETPAVERTGTDDIRYHWSCLRQAAPPLFGLCGELSLTQRRGSADRVTCPKCAKLARQHCAECWQCRRYAGKFGT